MIQRKPATSLTIGLFFVMTISGLLIFFEVGTGAVRATHEWTSIGFTIAALLHITVHLKPFTKYFREKTVAYILLACTAGGLLYVQSRGDLYAAEETYQQVIHSDLKTISPLFGGDLASLQERLADLGIEKANADQSLFDLAEGQGLDIYDVIEPLLLTIPNTQSQTKEP